MAEEETSHSIVWEATLDGGKYSAIVEGSEDPYTGTLIVKCGDTELSRQIVGLAYAARFGPDVGDVIEWEGIVERVVDADYVSKGLEPPK